MELMTNIDLSIFQVRAELLLVEVQRNACGSLMSTTAFLSWTIYHRNHRLNRPRRGRLTFSKYRTRFIVRCSSSSRLLLNQRISWWARVSLSVDSSVLSGNSFQFWRAFSSPITFTVVLTSFPFFFLNRSF